MHLLVNALMVIATTIASENLGEGHGNGFDWKEQLGDPNKAGTHAEEFASMFNLLDHDKDGKVHMWEAAGGLGIRSEAAAKRVLERLGGLSSTESGIISTMRKYQYHDIPPVPDHPSIFIDRIVFKARESLLNSQGEQYDDDTGDVILDVVVELRDYFEKYKCDDRAPPDITGDSSMSSMPSSSLTCGEMVNREDPSTDEVCAVLVNAGFCRFTCSVCVKEDHDNRNQGKGARTTEAARPGEDAEEEEGKRMIGTYRIITSPSAMQRVDDATGIEEELTVLVTSDWHSAPWYQIDGKGMVGDAVTRYRNCTYQNMWNCFEATGDDAVNCLLTGRHDPPRSFIQSHFDGYFMAAFGVKDDIRAMHEQKNVIFFIGDTQVHAVSDKWLNGMTPWVVEQDIVNATLSDILRHWSAEEVFFTPGNNDGPHNAIFVEQDNGTKAWARLLIDNSIVTNSLGWNYTRTLSEGEEIKNVSQVDFFRHTGYYVKKLPYLRGPPCVGNGDDNQCGGCFAIITNTNLGLHHFDQMQALYADLERIEGNQGIAYLLGHHPWIAPKMIPSRYQHLMRGVLSGHIHQAETTTPPPELFTQVPAISQNAEDTAFYIAKIASSSSSPSSEDQYRISVDYNRDLFVYQGEAGAAPNSTMWQLRDQGGSENHRSHHQKLMLIIIGSVAVLTLIIIGVIVAIIRRYQRHRLSQWGSVNNLEPSVTTVEEVRTAERLPHRHHLRQQHQVEEEEEEEEETLGSPLATSRTFALQNHPNQLNTASQ
mmetsp:Transcript_38083/g.63908  ORF Transcript_38083/g.63908 Transcript_38083/m.63908 type:complete len:764 (-) Transcript_38083:111-2402(-)